MYVEPEETMENTYTYTYLFFFYSKKNTFFFTFIQSENNR